MKKRVFEIIKIGNKSDKISRFADYFIVAVILLNLFSMFLKTFETFGKYHKTFIAIEVVTLVIFIAEYVLRLWTSDYLYPNESREKARIKFALSFDGIVEILTILPMAYFAGFVAFRMLRVVRIFHLFRVNNYSDSFHVIRNVFIDKKGQIASSIFVVLILMLASSLTIYSVEHEAQPENFANAFSGLWWSMSTLLTVGYGDIYPITVAGKILAMFIELLGVLVVAIPTGIISAGFVEQYSKMQNKSNAKTGSDIHCVVIDIDSAWVGKSVDEIELMENLSIVYYRRECGLIDDKSIEKRPNKQFVAQVGDVLGIYKF